MKKKLLKISLLNYLYKHLKIFRNRKPSFHYAEFGEDIFINRIFKNYKKGIYVDVGCYHPFKGSLTAKLYDKNWNGINIDISKTSIDLFNIVRKRDINLNYAISDFNGDTVFYENSPINQQNSLIKVNENQKVVKIECFTLNHILSENNIQKFDYYPLHFFSGKKSHVFDHLEHYQILLKFFLYQNFLPQLFAVLFLKLYLSMDDQYFLHL